MRSFNNAEHRPQHLLQEYEQGQTILQLSFRVEKQVV